MRVFEAKRQVMTTFHYACDDFAVYKSKLMNFILVLVKELNILQAQCCRRIFGMLTSQPCVIFMVSFLDALQS